MRALTVGDILDGAFRLLRARFGRIALLVLVVLGPFQLLSAFLTSRWLPDFGQFPGPETGEVVLFDDVAMGSLLGLVTVGGVLGFLIHVLVAGALIWLVLREDEGQRPALPEALRGALRRAWPIIAGSVLVVLAGLGAAGLVVLVAILVGMLAVPLGFVVGIPAMLLLGVTLTAATSLVVPVAMVETDAGPVRCAGRALSLVRRRFGQILGVTVLVLLVLVVVTMAIGLLFGVLSLVAGPLGWVVDGVSGTASSIISTPVTVFAALLLYIDARVRLEGWDLQLRAQRPSSW